MLDMNPRILLSIGGSLLMANLLCAQAPEDEKLASFYKNYLEENFHLQPLHATSLGDHRFDAQLDDISPEARQRWSELARHTLETLPRQVDYQKLSRDGQVDFETLASELTAHLWQESNLRPFERDARVYGHYLSDAVYLPLAKSTLPKEENIAHVIARMAEFPRIIEEAKRSLTHPVKPILETAIRQNLGAIAFYEKDLFNYTGETPQQPQLKAAADRVAAELKEYQKYLEGPMRERAEDNWRLGKDKFDRKFELETGVGVTAEENLADAEAQFALVHDQLYVVSRQLWSKYFPQRPLPPDDGAGRRDTITRVVDALSKANALPSPSEGGVKDLVAKVQARVENIKAFIRAKNYLRLPEPDRCAIIEMPEFRRGNALAYMDNAPPLDPQAGSYYAVSPPPSNWTPQQVRSFFEEYNEYMLQVLTIHEAYPGHYVQLEYGNRQPSLIRRALGSGAYIEGWAVYGEITMLNEGYGEGDLCLRLMQLKFYLRAIANSILDYKMHCTQMTDDEALKFLTEEAFQSEGEARLKIVRSKQSAVQLSTYFIGRMAHYRLRQAIEREQGEKFELARYHEAVLAVGAVQPKYLPELVRRRLGMAH